MSNKVLASLDIFDAQWAMMTRDQLADLLGTVNVRDLANAAKVSEKTIYRIRQRGKVSPNLTTVNALLDALKQMDKRKRSAKPAKAAA